TYYNGTLVNLIKVYQKHHVTEIATHYPKHGHHHAITAGARCPHLSCLHVYFCFQAQDGIRDQE
ncbi:hypothetical protein, partial [Stenotrophomonas maltophilia]|uniref:hypothetical protein n=1 Tax=Stenotrophomonas maltophilia TaxID=40324 RepID=UPI001C661B6C